MTEPKARERVKAGRSYVAPSNNLPSTVVAEKATPAIADSPNLISALARAASDPNVDPSKMRELYAIHKEMVEDENRIAFDDNLALMQAELPSISRDGKIEVRAKDSRGERTGAVQQSSPFASYPNIMKVLQPLLTRYGFGITSQAQPGAEGKLVIRTILSRKGIQRVSDFPLPADTTGSKNNAQGWGSASSYGKRYNVILLTNIVSHDPRDSDADGNDGAFRFARSKDGGEVMIEERAVEVISDDQLLKLREAIEDCGVETTQVINHFGIKKLSDLPAKLYETAIKDCADFKENQARKRAAAQAAPPAQGYRR